MRSAYLAWITVCVVWGTTYLGIRVALETIPPFLLGGIRYVIAGVLLAAILVARGDRLPGRAHWPGLLLLGVLMICLGNGGVIWAEQWVPSGIAAVIIASSPFWMAGIDAALPDGERITMPIVAGLLIGFAGIVVLVWPELSAGGALGKQFLGGLIALQIAEIGWSLGTVYSKRQGRHEPEAAGAAQRSSLGGSALQMLFGGLVMLAIGTGRGEWSALWFTQRSAVALAYLTLFGSIVGYSAYMHAVKHLPVSTVALYAYVNPIIAVGLGALLLGEPLGPRVILGATLVLLGVATVKGVTAVPSPLQRFRLLVYRLRDARGTGPLQ